METLFERHSSVTEQFTEGSPAVDAASVIIQTRQSKESKLTKGVKELKEQYKPV